MSLQYKIATTTRASNALIKVLDEYQPRTVNLKAKGNWDHGDISEMVEMKSLLTSKLENLDSAMNALTMAADGLDEDDEDMKKFGEKMDAVVDLQGKAQDVRDVLTALLSKGSSNSSINPSTTVMGVTAQTNGAAVSQVTRNLPAVKIPQFDGNRWEFDNFFISFDEHINKAPIPIMEKYTHLLNVLKGDAKALVSRYKTTPENYPLALELLKKKYDNPEATIRDLNGRLLKEAAKDNSTKEQRGLLDRMSIVVDQLCRLNENLDANLLKELLMKKFSPQIRKQVYRKQIEDDKEWNLQELFHQIDDVIYLEETVQSMMDEDQPKKAKEDSSSKQKHGRRDQADDNSSQKGKTGSKFRECYFCKSKDHTATKCTVVTNAAARKKEIIEQKRCIRCFSKGHSVTDCFTKRKCQNCEGDHHTALCLKKEESKKSGTGSDGDSASRGTNTKPKAKTTTQNVVQIQSAEGENEIVQCEVVKDHSAEGGKAYLPTFQAQALNPSTGEWSTISALVDTGADTTFIRRKLMEDWELSNLGDESWRLRTFGSKDAHDAQKFGRSRILLKTNEKTIQMDVLSVENLAGHIKKSIMTEEDMLFVQQQKLDINPEVFERAVDPDIVIGCDHIGDIWSGTAIKLPSGLMLIETAFGYTTMGRPLSNPRRNVTLEMDEDPIIVSNMVLQEDLVEYLQREDMTMHDGKEFTGSAAEEKLQTEKKVIEFFEKTVEKREEGYVVRIPFKEELVDQLPDNFTLSLKRLEQVLKNTPTDVKEMMEAVFKDQLEKGILEEVDINEETSNRIHYSPTHPVLTPHKNTTKCRVVVDGSAHYKNKLSLNDVIHQGPTILPNNEGMLHRFRVGEKAILSDVEKAFLQVFLNEADRDITRMLWVKDFHKPATPDNLRIFRSTRVMFGYNVSPFLLAEVIVFHLANYYNKQLAEQMKRNLFVDNLIITTDGKLEEMMRIYREIKSVFGEMNMRMREFISNDSAFNETIEECDRANPENLKVLGIRWDISSDQIKMECVDILTETLSRRTVAKMIASIYDPLGLLVPLLLSMKLFQRLLWVKEEEYQWDTLLNEDHESKWEAIVDKIEGFSVSLPRHVVDKSGSNIIVCFTDASIDAIAVCIYAKNQYGTNLMLGKSKVKPLKEVWTVPKLEMQALKVGAEKLQGVIEDLLEGDIQVSNAAIFSDSEIALSWVKSSPGKKEVGVLVKNRVESTRKVANELLQRGVTVSFGHVSSQENPADLGTRGIGKDEFLDCIWWNGPKFLQEDPEVWKGRQRMFDLVQSGDEITMMNVCRQIQESVTETVFDVMRTNSLPKMRRVVAYTLRAIWRMARGLPEEVKQRMLKNIPEMRSALEGEVPVSAEEHENAEVRIMREHQSQINVRKIKEWEKLNLQVNEDGLIICRGRLGNAEEMVFSLTPILVEPKTQLARMIIWNGHGKWHRNEQQTMTATREKFWIPKLRQQVKQMISKCIPCQRFNRAPFKYPDMADMPGYRVQRSNPFEFTGLDYFGPLEYRLEDGTKASCWGCLFSCATTRLSHIEMVTEMTTKAFLNAVRRFVSDRNKPKKIVSDNAPQFLLGNKILHEMAQRVQSDGDLDKEICEFLGNSKIEWSFITPYAPWQGGMYERMMRSIKQAMYKGIGRNVLLLDDLQTIMKEIAGMLNSRPLTYVGEELESGRVIRPNDFVYQRIDVNLPLHAASDMLKDYIPPEEINTTRDATIQALESSVNVLEQTWHIWSTSYMAELRNSHKLRMDKKKGVASTPFVGQIVLICDSNLPKNFWKLGKIVELKWSTDEILREVHLITSTGRVVRRPINLIVPLEIDEVTEEMESIEEEKESNNELDQSNQATQDPERTDKRTGSHEEEAVQEKEQNKYNLRKRKEVNYTEDEEETVGIFSAVLQTKLVKPSLPTILFLSMMACLINPVMSMEGASTLECTLTGIRINQRYDSFELCVKDYCTSRPRMAWNTGDSTDVWIPPAIKIAPHHCTAKLLINNELSVIEADCPSVDRCANIDCTICWSNFVNPECHPGYAIVGIGLLIYFSMMIVHCIFRVPVTIGGPIITFCMILKMMCCGCIVILNKCCRRRPQRRTIRWEKLIPIVLMLTQWSEGCQEIDSLTQSQKQCFKEDGLTVCKLITKDFLNINPYQKNGCVRIEKNGEAHKEVRITFKSIELECLKSTVEFTKEVQVKVWSSKRCPRTGSCQEDKCMNITRTSMVPELGEANLFVGNTMCTESCGGIGCGCFYPSSGCLFYRIYAQPKSNQTYEIFKCSEWKERVNFKVSVAQLRGTNPRIDEHDVSLPINLPMTVQDVTINVNMIHKPESPILGTWFIRKSDNMIATWEPHKSPHFRCLNPECKDEECMLQEDCICTPAEDKIKCDCKEFDLNRYFNTINYRLPTHHAHWRLVPKNGSVSAVIEEEVTTGVALTIRDNVTTSTLITKEKCRIENGHITGCYNCATGGVVELKCLSEKQKTIANIVCNQDMFSMPCSPQGTYQNITFFVEKAQFQRQCRVNCGGQHSEHFEIHGILKYAGSVWTSIYRIIEGKSSVTEEISWPDLKHLFESYLEFMESIIGIIIVAVAAFAITVATIASFMVLGPKKLLSMIISFFLLPLKGCASLYFFCMRRCNRNRQKTLHQRA